MYEWFKENVHHNGESYIYELRNNDKSHLAVTDIISPGSGNAHFRVILKITKSDVKSPYVHKKDYRELTLFNSTEPLEPITTQTALQVCFVQIDDSDKPVNAVIYTYVEKPERFVRFDLNSKS